MDKSLQELLHELEQFGLNNDSTITDRPKRMLNITRDTGEFCADPDFTSCTVPVGNGEFLATASAGPGLDQQMA